MHSKKLERQKSEWHLAFAFAFARTGSLMIVFVNDLQLLLNLVEEQSVRMGGNINTNTTNS